MREKKQNKYEQKEGLICYAEGLTQFSSIGGGQQNTLI